MTSTVPFVTAHAVQRYRERVDPTATTRSALQTIQQIVSQGRARSRPRHWTKVNARPGCRYVYCAAFPDICVVTRHGAAITVFARTAFASWWLAPVQTQAVRPPRPYKRDAARAWRDEEAA